MLPVYSCVLCAAKAFPSGEGVERSEAEEGGALHFYVGGNYDALPSSVTATPCQLPPEGSLSEGISALAASLLVRSFDSAVLRSG